MRSGEGADAVMVVLFVRKILVSPGRSQGAANREVKGSREVGSYE